MDDYYRVNFELGHVDYLDTLSWSSDLSFSKHWQLTSNWSSVFYVKYLYEDFQQASDQARTQLMMPGIRISYQADKPLQRGLQQQHSYSVEGSEPHLLSDSRVVRLFGESRFAWWLNTKNRFSVRGALGANITNDIRTLPPSLRFFAGGDGSIRGYKYESIAPKDENGELLGGLYTTTLGLDYQRQVMDSLWLGVFYDIGDAFDDKPEWR